MSRIYKNWFQEDMFELLSLVFLVFSVLSSLVIRALEEIREELELKILMKQ